MINIGKGQSVNVELQRTTIGLGWDTNSSNTGVDGDFSEIPYASIRMYVGYRQQGSRGVCPIRYCNKRQLLWNESTRNGETLPPQRKMEV